MTPGEKLVATNIKKHGTYDLWRASMSVRGRMGGEVKVPKGYAINRELAAEQGRKRKKVVDIE